ncbi:MAG: hypothetical protein ACREON_08035 [Gemmatimonadaceae bacterium]
MIRRLARRRVTLSAAAALSMLVALPALAGPPWISIEVPPNPYDRATRGAFLVVNAFHHGTPAGFPIAGTAEGLVNGKRQSVALSFERTSRQGSYALRKQWPTEGAWMLVISVRQGEKDRATALVELGAGGEVAGVRVPTVQREGYAIPREVTSREVDSALRERARTVVAGGSVK